MNLRFLVWSVLRGRPSFVLLLLLLFARLLTLTCLGLKLDITSISYLQLLQHQDVVVFSCDSNMLGYILLVVVIVH